MAVRAQWFMDQIRTKAGEPLAPVQAYIAKTVLDLVEQKGDANARLRFDSITNELERNRDGGMRALGFGVGDVHLILASLVRRGTIDCSTEPDMQLPMTGAGRPDLKWYFIPNIAIVREYLGLPAVRPPVVLETPRPRSRRSPLAGKLVLS